MENSTRTQSYLIDYLKQKKKQMRYFLNLPNGNQVEITKQTFDDLMRVAYEDIELESIPFSNSIDIHWQIITFKKTRKN